MSSILKNIVRFPLNIVNFSQKYCPAARDIVKIIRQLEILSIIIEDISNEAWNTVYFPPKYYPAGGNIFEATGNVVRFSPQKIYFIDNQNIVNIAIIIRRHICNLQQQISFNKSLIALQFIFLIENYS